MAFFDDYKTAEAFTAAAAEKGWVIKGDDRALTVMYDFYKAHQEVEDLDEFMRGFTERDIHAPEEREGFVDEVLAWVGHDSGEVQTAMSDMIRQKVTADEIRVRSGIVSRRGRTLERSGHAGESLQDRFQREKEVFDNMGIFTGYSSAELFGDAQAELKSMLYGNNAANVSDFRVTQHFLLWALATKEEVTPRSLLRMARSELEEMADEFTKDVRKHPLYNLDGYELSAAGLNESAAWYGSIYGRGFAKFKDYVLPDADRIGDADNAMMLKEDEGVVLSAVGGLAYMESPYVFRTSKYTKETEEKYGPQGEGTDRFKAFKEEAAKHLPLSYRHYMPAIRNSWFFLNEVSNSAYVDESWSLQQRAGSKLLAELEYLPLLGGQIPAAAEEEEQQRRYRYFARIYKENHADALSGLTPEECVTILDTPAAELREKEPDLYSKAVEALHKKLPSAARITEEAYRVVPELIEQRRQEERRKEAEAEQEKGLDRLLSRYRAYGELPGWAQDTIRKELYSNELQDLSRIPFEELPGRRPKLYMKAMYSLGEKLPEEMRKNLAKEADQAIRDRLVKKQGWDRDGDTRLINALLSYRETLTEKGRDASFITNELNNWLEVPLHGAYPVSTRNNVLRKCEHWFSRDHELDVDVLMRMDALKLALDAEEPYCAYESRRLAAESMLRRGEGLGEWDGTYDRELIIALKDASYDGTGAKIPALDECFERIYEIAPEDLKAAAESVPEEERGDDVRALLDQLSLHEFRKSYPGDRALFKNRMDALDKHAFTDLSFLYDASRLMSDSAEMKTLLEEAERGVNSSFPGEDLKSFRHGYEMCDNMLSRAQSILREGPDRPESRALIRQIEGERELRSVQISREKCLDRVETLTAEKLTSLRGALNEMTNARDGAGLLNRSPDSLLDNFLYAAEKRRKDAAVEGGVGHYTADDARNVAERLLELQQTVTDYMEYADPAHPYTESVLKMMEIIDPVLAARLEMDNTAMEEGETPAPEEMPVITRPVTTVFTLNRAPREAAPDPEPRPADDMDAGPIEQHLSGVDIGDLDPFAVFLDDAANAGWATEVPERRELLAAVYDISVQATNGFVLNNFLFMSPETAAQCADLLQSVLEEAEELTENEKSRLHPRSIQMVQETRQAYAQIALEEQAREEAEKRQREALRAAEARRDEAERQRLAQEQEQEEREEQAAAEAQPAESRPVTTVQSLERRPVTTAQSLERRPNTTVQNLERQPAEEQPAQEQPADPFSPAAFKAAAYQNGWVKERDEAALDALLHPMQTMAANNLPKKLADYQDFLRKEILEKQLPDKKPVAERNRVLTDAANNITTLKFRADRKTLEDLVQADKALEEFENQDAGWNALWEEAQENRNWPGAYKELLRLAYPVIFTTDGHYQEEVRKIVREARAYAPIKEQDEKETCEAFADRVEEAVRRIPEGERTEAQTRYLEGKAEALDQADRIREEKKKKERAVAFTYDEAGPKWKRCSLRFNTIDALYQAGEDLPEEHPLKRFLNDLRTGVNPRCPEWTGNDRERSHIVLDDMLRHARGILSGMEMTQGTQNALKAVDSEIKRTEGPMIAEAFASRAQKKLKELLAAEGNFHRGDQDPGYREILKDLEDLSGKKLNFLFGSYKGDVNEVYLRVEKNILGFLDKAAPEDERCVGLMRVMETFSSVRARAYKEKFAGLMQKAEQRGQAQQEERPVEARPVTRVQNLERQPAPQQPQAAQVPPAPQQQVPPAPQQPANPYINGHNANLAQAEVHMADGVRPNGSALRLILSNAALGSRPGRDDFRQLTDAGYSVTNRQLEKLFSADSLTRVKAVKQLFRNQGLEEPKQAELLKLVNGQEFKGAVDGLAHLGDTRILYNRSMDFFRGLKGMLDDQRAAQKFTDTWRDLSGSDRRTAVNAERHRMAFAREHGEAVAAGREQPWNLLQEWQKDYLLHPEKLEAMAAMLETKKHMHVVNWNSGEYNDVRKALNHLRGSIQEMNEFIFLHQNDANFKESFLPCQDNLYRNERELAQKLNVYLRKVTEGGKLTAGEKGVLDMKQDAGAARLTGARALYDYVGGEGAFRRDLGASEKGQYYREGVDVQHFTEKEEEIIRRGAAKVKKEKPGEGYGRPERLTAEQKRGLLERDAKQNEGEKRRETSYAELYAEVYKAAKEHDTSNAHRRAAEKAKRAAETQKAHEDMQNQMKDAAQQIKRDAHL